MQQNLVAAQRLIVALDFKPTFPKGRDWMREQVLTFAKGLKETEVRCLKLESLLRGDYSLIDDIHELGFQVFADLKLSGTKETLSTDGILLKRYKPDFVSVMCGSGPTGMKALKEELPETKILGVTALTNLTDIDTRELYSGSVEEIVTRFGQAAKKAEIHGLISAPKEARPLRMKFGHVLSLYAPAVRPTWANVSKDDQNPQRTMTPKEAVEAGVDYLIVGRPITEAENSRDAVTRIIEEIKTARYRP